MGTVPDIPGLYVDEPPPLAPSIDGVDTSITAFLGRARWGPIDTPTTVQSFAHYRQLFGGWWDESTMAIAVHAFFVNGGTDAIIVRLADGATQATLTLAAGADALRLRAATPGAWSNALRVAVDHQVDDDADDDAFSLTVQLVETPEQLTTEQPTPVVTEVFPDLSVDPASSREVAGVLARDSALVTVDGAVPEVRPDPTTADGPPGVATACDWVSGDGGGDDGNAITDAHVGDVGLEDAKRGLWALDEVERFSLLCLPPLSPTDDVGAATLATAAAYCRERRAFLVIDPPQAWDEGADAESGVEALRATLGDARDHAAVYFPRLRITDPLDQQLITEVAPGGAIAGIIARTDAIHGVWKAPAGNGADVLGINGLSVDVDDATNGTLNQLGINCLRTFQAGGTRVWGARTLDGDADSGSQWRYVPIRRLASFVEASVEDGTRWAAFEPNDQPLWARLQDSVSAFLDDLFQQGAFQGQSATDAYFVKVDSATTTPQDIDDGIVNIVIGIAPQRPAEFVILEVEQRAGQSAGI